MNVHPLTIPRDEAVKMWRKYQQHKHHDHPYDAEIEKIYKAIAAGKLVINALSEIVKHGLNDQKLPKLAIARADEKTLYLATRSNGCQMSGVRWVNGNTSKTRYFEFTNCFAGMTAHRDYKAIVPHIPPDVRPKRGLENYHILWEAEWTYEPPVDPMLLRRLGKTGDIWLVVAAWDLTDVERAVMAMHKPLRS